MLAATPGLKARTLELRCVLGKLRCELRTVPGGRHHYVMPMVPSLHRRVSRRLCRGIVLHRSNPIPGVPPWMVATPVCVILIGIAILSSAGMASKEKPLEIGKVEVR